MVDVHNVFALEPGCRCSILELGSRCTILELGSPVVAVVEVVTLVEVVSMMGVVAEVAGFAMVKEYCVGCGSNDNCSSAVELRQ